MITLAVRWYLRFALSYRDVAELLAERGLEIDHVTVYRWVRRFTPLLIDAARPCRHTPDDRWFVDETSVKVAGRWTCLYRAVDQVGQVIDVVAGEKRDLAAARRFFTRALSHGRRPVEVTTDRAASSPRVLDEQLPAAPHIDDQYANNPIEADHGRITARLQPMRSPRGTERVSLVKLAGDLQVDHPVARRPPRMSSITAHGTVRRPDPRFLLWAARCWPEVTASGRRGCCQGSRARSASATRRRVCWSVR
ncbi:transposase [Frankia casuarinae]|uniref:Transposase and inactivated derivatives-like n=1 Tax=Frankia casuarinae (strain DSM 45818 / CECT 9043 / HFP020203 / CcI3) TaxID=106370 RepID=Q2JC38_FRACC|nr:Transposase and inactivated derivatives-like [Frankia casuarinae]ETA00806.1 transposase [Frankia sp. CcI6]EYT89656.1 transposase [Frankia casuarinae]OAA21498.1 transposase [Frankia casuarinae]